MMQEGVAESESLPFCHGFNTGRHLIAASVCAPKDGTRTSARVFG
jgi:hypothetical protein